MVDTPPTTDRLEPPLAHPLRLTVYDQVASLIVALLVVIGFLVAILTVLVITRRMMVTRHVVGAELVSEEVAGRGDHPAGFEEDFREPGADALEALRDDMTDLLNAVTDDATALRATNPELLAAPNATNRQGQGDHRRPGRLGRGRDIVPRWERWEVRFSTDKLEKYAQQLDFFQIELAAVGGDKSLLEYASQLSQAKPQSRTGPGAEESRLYMTWRSGALRAADETFLQKAGIATDRKIILQFIPPAVEQQLAQLEQAHAGNIPLEKIVRTIFAVRGGPGKYEFYVLEQITRS